MEIFENAQRRLCVFVWKGNILKTKFFENEGVTKIMIFP